MTQTATPVFAPSSTPKAVPYPQSPVLEMPVAAAVLIANILIPGLGTIIAAVVGQHKMIARGILQFVLWIVIVGMVWAIVTGVQCLINAKR